MRILITGGRGFLGKHALALLLEQGYQVRVLSRHQALPPEFVSKKAQIEWFVGDLSNKARLLAACADCEAVLHLAWSTVPHSAAEAPSLDVHQNVIGSINLLEASVSQGVKKFVFLSSGGTVYGVPQQSPISEEHHLQPITPYGISKATVENYVRFFERKHQLDCCILRVANAYGEYQNLDKRQGVIGHWLDSFARAEPIKIWGDGQIIRDFVYVRDVAEALLKALELQNAPVKTFNIGSGEGLSLNDLVKKMQLVTQQNTQIVYQEARPDDVPSNVLDIAAAREVLGWQPRISLQEGLQNTWNWFLAHHTKIKT
ncbi:MAG: NAD-dependent epimerase/dehydratase family protein [Cytophagales bacterium]|nr:MAG: NAD-dependent epimerase/dehydratase family protein [Cytophagales bacterium]TAF59906.1 MAG: NAD-dependent epimerase/dehydratase family protein [Cytophagales bacterium]